MSTTAQSGQSYCENTDIKRSKIADSKTLSRQHTGDQHQLGDSRQQAKVQGSKQSSMLRTTLRQKTKADSGQLTASTQQDVVDV
jgi:hypothetical protein